MDRPALLAGAGAAAAGWGIVAVPVLLLWVATPYADGDLTAVPRLAAALWLLGHGGPLRWDGPAGHATLGVAPLLVTALAAGLVWQAAARTGRRGEVVAGYLAVAVPASLLGLGSAPRTEPLPDLFWAALLALFAAMAGARRATGEWGVVAAWRVVRTRGEWLGVWPVPAPDGGLARLLERARTFAPERDEALRAGLAGALALLGGGAVVFGVSMLVHLGAVGTLASLLAPDLVGRLSLLLLCVVLLPNAVIWSAAYALGTGFALGGHAAAVGTAPLAPVALPLLADAPTPGRSALGLAALAAPLAAGAVVGWALGRDAGSAGRDGRDVAKASATETGAGTGAETEAGFWARLQAGAGAGIGAGIGTGPGTDGAVPALEEAGAGEGPPVPSRGAASLAARVLGAAVCTGLLAGTAALWAGGALGDGALAVVGPPVGWTALAAFVWTGTVGLPTAFLLRWWHARAGTRPAAVDETDRYGEGVSDDDGALVVPGLAWEAGVEDTAGAPWFRLWRRTPATK
ncbi:DUF6350 family protein [Streptacidiphilus sp. MAP12-33]|uniref:cell division protein PerM n=1 Tax=Streptacidiphilus sp. MAP12-33 TaxID=3156266 RepID=UPI0035136189